MPPSAKRLSPPPAPTARGEATRAALIKAAHGLFLKHGFHGTSMRQIAQKAGLALGASYNHFANKEAMFAAVLDAYHPYHVVFPALEQVQGETVADFMRDAAQKVRAGIEQAEAETQLLPLMLIELVEFRGRHLAQLAERLMPTLLTFIQRFAQQPGQLRPLPAPIMLRSFMSLMIGHMLTGLALKHSALAQTYEFDWFDGMVEIYLHGILTAEA